MWRQRGMLLRSQGRQVQHMQKALTQMNLQLTNEAVKKPRYVSI
jgi:hypothetical protein